MTTPRPQAGDILVSERSARADVFTVSVVPGAGDETVTRYSAAIELVKNPATREPLAPYGASSPEMNELIGACKSRGLLPFANFNRIHVVPPLNITGEDLQAGLAILDEVFDLSDAHVQG